MLTCGAPLAPQKPGISVLFLLPSRQGAGVPVLDRVPYKELPGINQAGMQLAYRFEVYYRE